MSVDVELSSAFGIYTDDKLNFQVQAQTVREALHDLVKQSPKLKRVLLNKDGDLQQTYDFFINGQSVYPKNMTKPLNDGDKLNVLYLIHGG
jgi:molybdopterin converting factor small subunit